MDSKIKILVVDDDEGILDALWLILRQAGYEVELQADGTKLINDYCGCHDLILLDNKLSGIEGTFICQHLKSKPETKNIPVILLSAVHDLEEKSRSAGADDFIEKPFTIHALLSKIKANIPRKSQL